MKNGTIIALGRQVCFALVCLLWFGAIVSRADTHYVSLSGTNDSPYTNGWASAATNIQWAVDAAVNAGDKILVSNDTYMLTNQISITNSVTLQSVNGYTSTVINGNWPAYTTRVVYVNNTGAVISGFTITNGYSTNQNGCGIYVQMGNLVTNCLITGNTITNQTNAVSLYGSGCNFANGKRISHCIITGNRALGNQSYMALVVGLGIASNCVISGNDGGISGAGQGALALGDTSGRCTGINCTVSYNKGLGVSISPGGYLYSSTVNNNTNNGVGINGQGTVRNCLITRNGGYGILIGSPFYYSGNDRIENCTIAHNVSTGVYFIYDPHYTNYVDNSIIYYNGPGGTNNWGFVGTNITYTNCCIYPIPTNVPGQPEGTGNITNEPLFQDTNSGNYHLSQSSPCINRGTNQSWMTNAVDLDGRMRIRYGRVDMGAYERIYEGSIYTVH